MKPLSIIQRTGALGIAAAILVSGAALAAPSDPARLFPLPTWERPELPEPVQAAQEPAVRSEQETVEQPMFWDGERWYTFADGEAALLLECRVQEGEQLMLRVSSGKTQFLRAAGYDPLLEDGEGCLVTYPLVLPAGDVRIICGGVELTVPVAEKSCVSVTVQSAEH